MAKEARAGLRLVDRLVLFLAWVATCGLVYVLGFYVGKGTHEQQLGKHQRVVRLPINAAPPPPDARTGRSSEFTFYETLTAGRRDAAAPGGPDGEAPAEMPAEVPTPGAPAVPGPPAAPLTGAPGAPGTSVTPPTPAAPKAPPVAGTPPASQTARAVVPPPARPGTPPTATTSGPTTAATPTTMRPAVPPNASGRWTVEVSPTLNRLELEALRARLSDKGYDARVVTVRRDGNTWYRLRVGRYLRKLAQATQVMRTLREQEGVPRAFVASQ